MLQNSKIMILTITTNISLRSYDIEVPDGILVEKFTSDVVECLNSMNGRHFVADSFAVVSNRMDKILMPDETLEEAGVWNGDYISLMYVE